jgi:hypothetical protein
VLCLFHRPQALEALRKLRTEKAQEAKEMRLKLDHTRTLKDQAQVTARGTGGTAVQGA